MLVRRVNRRISRLFSTAPKEQQTVILSGIQPTGTLHLGNYLGAVANWVDMAKNPQNRVLLTIVDLHAITVPQDPKVLRAGTRHMAACLMACGIKPSANTSLFIQSHVKEHAELGWLLSCVTPMAWLNRMTQFKEKARQMKSDDAISLGLFAYPVLQAADILLYRAHRVPVGEDQRQHLELARHTAAYFNRRFASSDKDKDPLFPEPEPVNGRVVRVMNLRDGRAKMSKSAESDMTRINLTDEESLLVKKIRKAKTDSNPMITYEPETRPEVANLLRIFSTLSDRSIESIVSDYQGENATSRFKEALVQVLTSHLSPIRAEVARLESDPGYLDDALRQGADQAREIASDTMRRVKDAMGLL